MDKTGLKSVKTKPTKKKKFSIKAVVASFVHWVTHDPYPQFVGILSGMAGFGFLIFSAIQLNEDIIARDEERKQAKEERIARAWDNLFRPAGGNIGKGRALQTIIEDQVEVSGLNLSCENVGEFRGDECIRKPQFNGLRFSDSKISESIFRNTEINDLHIDLSELVYMDLNHVTASNWNIYGSRISGIYERIVDFNCYDCDFVNTTIPPDVYFGTHGGDFSSVIVYFSSIAQDRSLQAPTVAQNDNLIIASNPSNTVSKRSIMSTGYDLSDSIVEFTTDQTVGTGPAIAVPDETKDLDLHENYAGFYSLPRLMSVEVDRGNNQTMCPAEIEYEKLKYCAHTFEFNHSSRDEASLDASCISFNDIYSNPLYLKSFRDELEEDFQFISYIGECKMITKIDKYLQDFHKD